jgi:hypothetical protein
VEIGGPRFEASLGKVRPCQAWYMQKKKEEKTINQDFIVTLRSVLLSSGVYVYFAKFRSSVSVGILFY